MIKTKQFGCALLLLVVFTSIGYSQETISEYVAPSEAVPKGKAPRMQVQLLSADEPTKQYASSRRSITLRVRISPLLER
jgi:hypothetical protein